MKNLKRLTPIVLVAFFAACSTDSYVRSTDSIAPTRVYQAGMEDDWSTRTTTIQQAPVQPAPAPRPAPAARPAPAPSPVSPTPLPPRSPAGWICSEPIGGPAPMSIAMPRETTMGDTFAYDINISASECVGNVVVTDTIPSGASYVRSEPAGEQAGDRLRWNLGELDKGQNVTIKVWLRADKEGTLASCATISADPRTCSQIFVGRAVLALEKTGPETATLGSTITYLVTVSNRGSSVARNVVVVDELPEGLISSLDRRTATLEVGDLAPNESKTVSIAAKTVKRGRWCNVANATSANAGEARAEACTTVVEPGLSLTKEGTKEQFLTRIARYNLVVANTGDTPLTGVVVTDTAPANTSITAAPGGTVNGNVATWNVGTLNVGEQKTLDISLTSRVAGQHCNTATAVTAEGLRKTAEACTLWTGIGAVLLEVVDDPDPIRVDEETVYTIRVTNQGTADLNNIRAKAEFDTPNTPVSTSAGTITGQKIEFPTVPKLAPKQTFSYTVRVKGVTPGDARNKMAIASDEIVQPVIEEESTRVF